jgi:hypothetical protein
MIPFRVLDPFFLEERDGWIFWRLGYGFIFLSAVKEIWVGRWVLQVRMSEVK